MFPVMRLEEILLFFITPHPNFVLKFICAINKNKSKCSEFRNIKKAKKASLASSTSLFPQKAEERRQEPSCQWAFPHLPT